MKTKWLLILLGVLALGGVAWLTKKRVERDIEEMFV